MDPTAVKVLWWIGSAVVILVAIVVLVAVTGVWPQTYLELEH